MSKKKDSQKGKKGQKEQEQEDLSTENLIRFYRKKCDLYNVPFYKPLQEAVDLVLEDAEHLKKLHIYQSPIGVDGVRAITETLSDLSYQHLQELYLFQLQMKDEGLQFVCNYMEKGKCVKQLQVSCNDITPQGCEYLGKTLSPGFNLPLLVLKLDHNNIGTDGLKALTNGLSLNATLQKLSLQFCNIDPFGAKYIQEILGLVTSSLYILKLQGNFLRNEGTYQVLRAMETNNKLWKIDLRNNQFGDNPEVPVVKLLCEVLMKNNTCQCYQLQDNAIYDQDARNILEVMKMNQNIWRVFLPETITNDILTDKAQIEKKRQKKKKQKQKKKGKQKK